jgi:hypothetical protein
VDLCSSFSGTGEASVFDICLDLSGVELNEITITMKISPDQSLRVKGRAPLAAHSNGALPGQWPDYGCAPPQLSTPELGHRFGPIAAGQNSRPVT